MLHVGVHHRAVNEHSVFVVERDAHAAEALVEVDIHRVAAETGGDGVGIGPITNVPCKLIVSYPVGTLSSTLIMEMLLKFVAWASQAQRPNAQRPTRKMDFFFICV